MLFNITLSFSIFSRDVFFFVHVLLDLKSKMQIADDHKRLQMNLNSMI